MSVTIKDYTPESAGQLNDEQPERDPLLSDEQFLAFRDEVHSNLLKHLGNSPDAENLALYRMGTYVMGMDAARDFYEDLITKGELRVVKYTTNDCGQCKVCGDVDMGQNQKYCHNCGAKIVE